MTSSRVIGSAVVRISDTGCVLRYENPKSPWTKLLAQRQYCSK